MGSEDLKVRHSVMKGLWFPILNNLTNLIMERRRDIQEKSSALFFKILNSYSTDFNLDFWREIMNQIVLPLLEDIHLAVEIPSKK
jgi:DNA mismatch repair protein MutH